ncbi:MAG: hypothetical protein KC900_09465 [Candidatus Omnitrophica bacterium]|nr:hypothetical protein [Candidatus Omnitrophota bacterium]
MKKLLFTIIIFGLACGQAAADTIYLKSGRIIRNRKVVQRTPIYIRVEPRFLGDPEREFLVENVDRVVIGKDNAIPAAEVMDYVSVENLDDVPDDIKLAAKQMAMTLLEQAMQSVLTPTLEEAPENVKRVAEQKASDLLASAMASLNDTPDNVKSAAREIANSLLEETVRTTALDSIDEVPEDVRRVAQEKAGFLIEQAMVDSVEEAPNQVKLAAKLKAQALIEDAMREVNILEGVINEGQTAQDRFEVSSIIQRNKQQLRARVTTFDRMIDQADVDALMDEAVQRRVADGATFDFQSVPGTEGMVEKMVVAPEPQMSERTEAAAHETAESRMPPPLAAARAAASNPQIEAVDPPAEVQVLSEKELAARIAAIPQPTVKGMGFMDFMSALSYRDYMVMGLCVVLLLVLLSQQSQARSRKKDGEEEADIQVVSSLTFQHLPDAIKRKFTSSDITMILDLEDQFRQSSGKNTGEMFIDDENLLKFIQEQAQKAGGLFTLDDLKKVLEVKEQTLTETGMA